MKSLFAKPLSDLINQNIILFVVDFKELYTYCALGYDIIAIAY